MSASAAVRVVRIVVNVGLFIKSDAAEAVPFAAAFEVDGLTVNLRPSRVERHLRCISNRALKQI